MQTVQANQQLPDHNAAALRTEKVEKACPGAGKHPDPIVTMYCILLPTLRRKVKQFSKIHSFRNNIQLTTKHENEPASTSSSNNPGLFTMTRMVEFQHLSSNRQTVHG